MRQIYYINVKCVKFVILKSNVFRASEIVTCNRKGLSRVKMVVSYFFSVRQTCYILCGKLIEFVTFNKILHFYRGLGI